MRGFAPVHAGDPRAAGGREARGLRAVRVGMPALRTVVEQIIHWGCFYVLVMGNYSICVFNDAHFYHGRF